MGANSTAKAKFGFSRRRQKARKLIHAIELQRQGREEAFREINRIHVASPREMAKSIIGFIALSAIFLKLLTMTIAPSNVAGIGVLILCAEFYTVLLFKDVWAYYLRKIGKDEAHFFFSKKAAADLDSTLKRMQKWNAKITAKLEEQEEYFQAYENLRETIEKEIKGALVYHEDYASNDISLMFYYTMTLPSYFPGSKRQHRFYLFLNEADFALTTSILEVYERNVAEYD